MTVVTIWKEDGALWVAADTRISNRDVVEANGSFTLTDSGSKVFPLPVRLHAPNPTQFRLIESLTFGFAFSGSTLAALTAITTVTALSSHLYGFDTSFPISLRDIANLVRKVGERVSSEILTNTRGRNGTFEAAVFGWCPRNGNFEVFHLAPNVEPVGLSHRATMLVNSCTVCELNPILTFGVGKERLSSKIEEIARNGDKNGRTTRIPRLAVEALVEESHGGVGGSLTLGIATQKGFELNFTTKPLEIGKPDAWRNFNGVDLDQDIGQVGYFIVGMPGMA